MRESRTSGVDAGYAESGFSFGMNATRRPAAHSAIRAASRFALVSSRFALTTQCVIGLSGRRRLCLKERPGLALRSELAHLRRRE
jgi:hypothetical protein